MPGIFSRKIRAKRSRNISWNLWREHLDKDNQGLHWIIES
jgi:hypothetical protein